MRQTKIKNNEILVLMVIIRTGDSRIESIQQELKNVAQSPVGDVYRVKIHQNSVSKARVGLKEKGFLNEKFKPTQKGYELIRTMSEKQDDLTKWMSEE